MYCCSAKGMQCIAQLYIPNITSGRVESLRHSAEACHVLAGAQGWRSPGAGGRTCHDVLLALVHHSVRVHAAL